MTQSPGFSQTARVFAFLEAHPTRWFPAAQIAFAVDLAVSTTRTHLRHLVAQRLVDRVRLRSVIDYRLADSG